MANTSDQPTPTPDQPDPKKPGAKPTPAPGEGEGQRKPTGGSTFEFKLPDDVGSYSDMPPVPQPDGTDATNPQQAALPPRPAATRSPTASFDFIDLPDIDPSMLPGAAAQSPPPVPAPAPAPPPLLIPTDDVVLLPPLPVPTASDSAVPLGTLTPTPNPSSFTLGGEVLDLANLPTADPASDTMSVPDIASLYPMAQPPSSFVLGQAVEPLPVAPDDSGETLGLPTVPGTRTSDPSTPDVSALFPPPEPGTAGAPAMADLELPTADPGSFVMGDVVVPAEAVEVVEDVDVVAAAAPYDSSGSFMLPSAPPSAPSDASVPDISLMFPPVELTASDPVVFGSSPEMVVEELPTADPGSFVMGDPVPPAGAVYDPEAVVGNLEPVNPVAPASGWLDSDVLTITSADPTAMVPTAEPVAGPFDPLPSDVIDSSDIFSGVRGEMALPVEQSDVIAATAYGNAPPAGPVRPSEVALTFDNPPGSSTLHDGTNDDDMPVADELPDSGILVSGGLDAESIHDMPDPVTADPLFDSAQLADAPDLPAAPPPPADAPEYGAMPTYSADASSILADLNEPSGLSGMDSSSVRVESPGVDRTLTGSAAEGAFDLTVADEAIPADLFDEPSDATQTESTDWQLQSGSDLFAEGRTTPEIDLDAERAGTVEPVDADLTGEQPSLSSAPSSIFSGDRPPASGSGGSAGSANVRIGTPEPPSDLADADLADVVEADLADVNFAEADVVEADLELTDADAAEFGAYPALNETAEREADALPAVPPQPARKPSTADFELPPAPVPVPAADEDDGGAIDWDAAGLADDENATRGIPQDVSLSAILRGLPDDSAETATRDARPLAAPVEDAEEEADKPVVTVDWMAGSVEGPAAVEAEAEAEQHTWPEEDAPKPKPRTPEPAAREEKTKPTKGKPAKVRAVEEDTGGVEEVEKSKPARGKPARRAEAAKADDTGETEKAKPAKQGGKKGGIIIALLAGGFLAAGTATAVYFSGIIPNEKSVQAPPKQPDGVSPGTGPGDGTQQPPPPPANAADPLNTFAAGGTAQALEMLKAKAPANTEEKAAAGYVRVFAKVQELGKTNAAAAGAEDEDLKLARAELKAVLDDADSAKTVEGAKRAVAAKVRLGVSYEVAGNAAEARREFTEGMAMFPKHAAVFEALIDRLDAAEKAPGTSFRAPARLAPDDARRILFAVSLLLAADPANADEEPEPGLFYWKAVNQATAGKYPEAIELIGKAKAAHVKRAKALAGRGLNPLTDPLEQMFARNCDELVAYWKLRADLYGNPAIADAIKKNGLGKTIDALVKAEKDLTTAKADLGKLEKEVTAAKEEAVKLDKEVKKAIADKLAAELAVEQAATDLKAKQKEKDDLLATLATELKPAKVLPEKPTQADIVAGVKVAASLAGGADAQRVVKAEAATKAAEATAKAATDKLLAETKKLTAKAETDIAAIKAENAVEMKKLVDTYAADLKKLKDGNAADVKKLTDDHLAAIKKLKDDGEAAVKAEQAKTEAEKKAAAAKEIGFQKQLANAVTPAQAVDIWLPVLTDLRRASDADPAIAIAARAIDSSAPDSEDAAKAHTVTGMGLFLKGNFAGAKDEFQAARRNPTYEAAKGKAAWAKAADAGLDAIDDPLAPYRQPVVVPPVDLKAAARSLDTGIAAYKAGKYDAAATALADAAKNDPADPVAWYYLGAARLALGDAKQADKDIGQGAEREKVSPLPARTVSAALSPIQGAARSAIDKARP